MKSCGKCNISKESSYFSKKSNWCKDCNKEYSKNYYMMNKEKFSENSKEYYINNSEKIKLKSKEYRDQNPGINKEYFKEYYLENKYNLLEYKKEHYNNNKDKYLEKSKRYREDNPEKYSEYLREWRDDNSEYSKEYLKVWWTSNSHRRKKYWINIRNNRPHYIAWRSCLQSSIQRIGGTKELSTIELLRYSSHDIKSHMESLFKEGMSWDNWGEWHIDHKYPISKFSKDTPMYIVNSLDNLQPLWACDNLSKSNKI